MKAAAIGLGLVLALTGYGWTQATSSDTFQATAAPAQADSSTDLQTHAVQETKPDTNNDKDSSQPDHRYRMRLGGFAMGAGYRYFSGPGYPYGFEGPYGFYPYGGLYSSVFWEPFWGGFPFLSRRVLSTRGWQGCGETDYRSQRCLGVPERRVCRDSGPLEDRVVGTGRL